MVLILQSLEVCRFADLSYFIHLCIGSGNKGHNSLRAYIIIGCKQAECLGGGRERERVMSCVSLQPISIKKIRNFARETSGPWRANYYTIISLRDKDSHIENERGDKNGV